MCSGAREGAVDLECDRPGFAAQLCYLLNREQDNSPAGTSVSSTVQWGNNSYLTVPRSPFSVWYRISVLGVVDIKIITIIQQPHYNYYHQHLDDSAGRLPMPEKPADHRSLPRFAFQDLSTAAP